MGTKPASTSRPKRVASTRAMRASVRPKSGASRDETFYRNPDNWPDFDDSVLDKPTRDRLKVCKAAAKKQFLRQPMRKVIEDLPFGQREFQTKMKKAVSAKPNGSGIWGIEAFIPYRAQPSRVRSADVGEKAKGSRGFSGALGALFYRHPEIREGLIDFLTKRTRPNDTPPHVLHVEFKRLCRLQGLGEDDYPFCTETEGRSALIRWFSTKFMRSHFDAYVSAEYGTDAATALGHSGGDGKTNTPAPPFSEWVLDETPLDVNAKVESPSLLGDTDHHEARRGCVLRLMSMNPTVNLSWRLVLTPQASGADIAILLFDGMSGQRPPLETVPKCFRLATADWAANAYPQLKWVAPIRIYLDNALSHLFDTVQNLVTFLWGAEVKLGNPANPKERAVVEAGFSKQSRRVTSQVPSTSGTNPKDPRKKKSRVPVNRRVRHLDLIHILDTYIVNENATAAQSSLFRTPIDRLGSLLAAGLIPLNYIEESKRKAYWFCDPQDRPVHSNLSNGRAPYINFEYTRYSSTQMRDLPNMGGILRIRCDLRNLQTVHAWNEDGSYFGELVAEGQWGKVPNDLRMRKMFGHYKRRAALSDRADDAPMQALFQHLKNGAPTNTTMALQLAYVTHYLLQHIDSAKLAEWGEMVAIAGKPEAANEAPAGAAQSSDAMPAAQPPVAPDAPALEGTAVPAGPPSAASNAAAAASAPAPAPAAPAPKAPPKLVIDNVPRVQMSVPRRLRS